MSAQCPQFQPFPVQEPEPHYDDIETRGTKPSDMGASAASDWNEQVTLEIGPHPDLSETQQKISALDYGMRGGRTKIRVRRAFLNYALKRLGLDTDPRARRPRDQKIVLLNREAVTSCDHAAAGAHG